MKIIISHDVDHLFADEHLNDLILLKHIIRSKIELFKGKISIGEFFFRFAELFKNKLNRIEDIIDFDMKHLIPSTFFIGVNKGLGLNYSLKNAEIALKLIQSKGFETGVHGIAFENFDDIKKEFESFAQIVGHRNFGIRMHYLRNNSNTLKHLSDVGYIYDATLSEPKSTYVINNLTEFPVHIMDGWMINEHKAWQVNNLKSALDKSKQLIDEGFKNNIDYFSILFHDRYFSDGFKTWKNWYIQLTEYLIQNNFQFVNYKTALKERELIKD